MRAGTCSFVFLITMGPLVLWAQPPAPRDAKGGVFSFDKGGLKRAA